MFCLFLLHPTFSMNLFWLLFSPCAADKQDENTKTC
jgi:hypothetical protein